MRFRGLLLGLLYAASANAGVIVVTSGLVDTSATTISGRAGSVEGPNVTDPPAIDGVMGIVQSLAQSVAGPVPPANPPSPSLPGTDGVVSAEGLASLVFEPDGCDLSINASLSVWNDFHDLDGGTYLAQADATFAVEFIVERPTAFALTGQTAWDDEDVLTILRLDGETTGLHAFIITNGPLSVTGTLPPDNYVMTCAGHIYEVPATSSPFSESGAVDVNLALTVITPHCAGDTNNDNTVDLSDLSALLSGYGITAGALLSQGDLDCDGDVDLLDLSTLLAAFGGSC